MVSFLSLLLLLVVVVAAAAIARRRPYVPFRSRLRGLVLASCLLALLILIFRNDFLPMLRWHISIANLIGYVLGSALAGIAGGLIAALIATGLRLLLDGFFQARAWALATTAALALLVVAAALSGNLMAIGALASVAILGMLVHALHLGLAAIGIVSIPKPVDQAALAKAFE
jgi:hypothetical protein